MINDMQEDPLVQREMLREHCIPCAVQWAYTPPAFCHLDACVEARA